tara:strand:- start:363 stop:530 length:168 start_codon:yes stop_codon:yes gene_type:complete
VQVSATAFDLPVVVEALPPAERLQGGVAFVAGNMFTDLPNADVVLLKRLLHSPAG